MFRITSEINYITLKVIRNSMNMTAESCLHLQVAVLVSYIL